MTTRVSNGYGVKYKDKHGWHHVEAVYSKRRAEEEADWYRQNGFDAKVIPATLVYTVQEEESDEQ